MCNVDVEHLQHLFFDFKFAADCWQQKNLFFDMRHEDSMPLFLLNKLSSESHVVLIRIVVVL